MTAYINSYKNFVEKCKAVWDLIKGKLRDEVKQIKYPVGAYMPGFALRHVALRS